MWQLVLQKRRWGVCHHRCYSSAIPGMSKRKREEDYERIVVLEKPYNKVMALKELLMKEPEHVIAIAELRNLRTKVGISARGLFITLASRYPSFFELYQDETRHMWLGFTPQSQHLIDQDMALRKSYESMAVQNLRKLLMMSVDKRMCIFKIAQLRQHLGLPPDFHSRLVYAYPQYFRVLEEKCGPVLQLTCWDPALAITSLEKRAINSGELSAAGFPLFRIRTPKTLHLSKEQQQRVQKFQELPYISPYADSRNMDKHTPEFEKRQVALLHEILSMTLEKKTVIDYLTHFRKEYRLPYSVLALALRHHTIFYVSRKGTRFNIFLKEAYEGVNLVEKNEWNMLKEQYIALMK